MRWVIALAVAVVVGIQTAPAADKASEKQLQFNLRVFEGDPLGSVEAGTVKVLAEPCLRAVEGHACRFNSGGEIPLFDGRGIQYVPFGLHVETKAHLIQQGKVHVDITLSNVTVVKRDDEQIQTNSEATRVIATLKLGEVVKLRRGKGSASKQAWVELSVEEAKP